MKITALLVCFLIASCRSPKPKPAFESPGNPMPDRFVNLYAPEDRIELLEMRTADIRPMSVDELKLFYKSKPVPKELVERSRRFEKLKARVDKAKAVKWHRHQFEGNVSMNLFKHFRKRPLPPPQGIQHYNCVPCANDVHTHVESAGW